VGRAPPSMPASEPFDPKALLPRYSVYLLCWFAGTAVQILTQKAVLSGLQYSVYLLYWYKSTYTDTEDAAAYRVAPDALASSRNIKGATLAHADTAAASPPAAHTRLAPPVPAPAQPAAAGIYVYI
jgi:hypothetical protein